MLCLQCNHRCRTETLSKRLEHRVAVLTHAQHYMGPATNDVFEREGAKVHALEQELESAVQCQEIISAIGRVDILVANLTSPTFSGTEVTDLSDLEWMQAFDRLVHSLHWMTQAVLPQMIARRSGKIIVYGSASGLRGMKTLSAYSAARAAQIGYVQSVGVEIAPHNIQMNLIAQNYVESRDYYPPELMEKESFVISLKRQVPAGRLGKAEEDAQLALFLASDESNFICAQIIPFSGGWIHR